MKITDIKTRLLHVPVESALVNQTKSVAYMEVITVEILRTKGSAAVVIPIRTGLEDTPLKR